MKLILLILIIFLFGCGPSQEEKENIATIACNIMGETRMMDAALRIREINNAREQIDAPPFLGSDKEILESFQYELCKDLVLDDNYQEKLSAQRSLEEEPLQKERESVIIPVIDIPVADSIVISEEDNINKSL